MNNANINNYTIVNKINEKINNVTTSTSTSVSIDYNLGSLFYTDYTKASAFTQNYTVNLTNVNTLSQNNQTYVVTIISDVSGLTNFYYANNITIGGASTPINFLNGSSSISISQANTLFQQFSIIYTTGQWRVFSNVSSFYT